MPREEKNMLPSLTMGGKEMAKQAGKLQPTAVKDHGNYVQWDVLNMTKVCCVPTHIKKQHTFYIHIEKKKERSTKRAHVDGWVRKTSSKVIAETTILYKVLWQRRLDKFESNISEM